MKIMKRTVFPNTKEIIDNPAAHEEMPNGYSISGAAKNGKAINKNGMHGKEKIFIEEYLIDFNATRAAKAAGYSEKTAYMTGFYLTKNPKIQRAIKQAMQKRIKRTQVDQDQVVLELARVAFADISNFAAWGSGYVHFLDSACLPQDETRSISEVSQNKDGVRIKLYDKLRALELLGKHLGLFTETVKHIGAKGDAIEVVHEFTDETIKAAYDTLYRK